ncbi:long-chain-fatty-acid--CoA ligase [Pseudoduganella ginsengisoli]|uniref:Long-chain-fatty-acid--CoA ligase n=1 Tax=Pseudoduganella ginsengisoli TaxID=1462440 RepID=A0A6L6Q513_9BURK|nr:AMP-binding protein [Pseudoduganella ginsengisoli]MTW04606.1 AMP-binding protein [Pseudoduganella ginsengisoli]
MHKVWLEHYPPGIPAEVQVDVFKSLNALFAWICSTYGDRPAFSNLHTTLTWHELEGLVHRFAAYLCSVAGLRGGDRLAVMMPNLLQYPVALFGALRAGCVVVNVNPLYTARELQHQLADSGATAIVVLDHFAHTLEQALPQTAVRHVIVTQVGDLLHFPKAQIVNLLVRRVRHMVPDWRIRDAVRFADALRRGAECAPPAVQVGREDCAFLQYTGGTTGVPKGAVLSHGNLLANIEQTAAWVTGTLAPGAETALVPLPLYHVFALTAALTFCRLGAHIVLVTDPRDVPALIRELRHYPVSVMIGVNTLFGALLDQPALGKVPMDRLKLVVAGGMAVQRPVAERWQQATGRPLIEGYGLTETAPIVCANPVGQHTFSGAIGLPLPSTEVAIMDDRGEELPYGQGGEICVRGPQVMQGYWNMPDETARVFHADGWLRTGDIGVMDERGVVRLVDRKKDVIVVSGFKVYPNEVEEVVAMHPGVAEVAAIRASDLHSGETVKIVVVRRDPALTAEDLLAHCSQYLTGYKLPRIVVFRAGVLPKSPIGKILRRVVWAEEESTASSMADT